MQTCASRTFTASPDLTGTPLVLDQWLPLQLSNITSLSVVLVGAEQTVPAILDESGAAILDEGGGAVLEQ